MGIVLLMTTPLFARDYHFPALEVTIWLQADGSLLVQEDRTYAFNGRYSEGYRTFPTDGMARFSGFEVSETGKSYQVNESREPGSMRVEENQNEKELQWFYDARDTTRVFSIRFRVDGAVQRFEDVAVLYYQVISADWEKVIDNISVQVIPPEPLDATDVRQWWHGSLDILSETMADGHVMANLNRLPANTYMEVRALYPQHLFEGLPLLHGMAAPDVMAEEALWAEEANRLREKAARREAERKQRHESGKSLMLPLSLLIIVGWIWLYRHYGRRPAITEETSHHPEELPNQKPALVNYLMMNEMVTADAMLATLFDLANHGILTITEQDKTEPVFWGMSKTDTWLKLDRQTLQQQKDRLLPYEQMLLSFLFDDLANGHHELNLSVMKKKRTKVMTFFQKWNKQVKSEGRQQEWVDPRSRTGRNIGMIASGILFFAGILLVIFYGPWLLLFTGLSIVTFIASLAIMHRTARGQQVYLQWHKIRKLLKRYHKEGLKRKPDSESLARYVIYGVALGLGQYHMRRFFKQLDKEGYHGYLPWIVMHSASNKSYGDVISKVITTTATTLSSSSGAGGGGSMGGGGGVSSGGGGAR